MRKNLLLVVLFSLGIAGPVFAQAPSGLTPVDQAVGDIDLLATSLRVIEPGSRPDGQQSSLFQANPESPSSRGVPWAPAAASPEPTYYRIGPGFRARLNKIDYLIPRGRKRFSLNTTPSRDGVFIELIPPNTVFELDQAPWSNTNTTQQNINAADSAAIGTSPPDDPRMDHRIDLRIDNRIHGTADWMYTPTTSHQATD